jgi:hypothetical protein
VGNHLLENVTASVASAQADLLLGQSFLSRFNSWSIDNRRQFIAAKLKEDHCRSYYTVHYTAQERSGRFLYWFN